jgi:hypothetical protein
MRSGLWPRRLSRWRTRKSLPTAGAAFRAASATARDVSRGFHPGGRVVAARRGGGRRRQATGRRRDEQTGHHGVREEAHHFAAQVTRIRLEWMPKEVAAAAKSAEVAGATNAKGNWRTAGAIFRGLCALAATLCTR